MKSGGVLAASFLLSIIVCGSLGYFVGPMIFPSLRSPAFESVESNTTAIIYDDDLTWTKIPKMELNITIQQGSRISAQIGGTYLLGISSSMTSRVLFNVAVCITGIGNNTQCFTYYRTTTESYNLEISSPFAIQYISEQLAGGTYEVNAFYKSKYDSAGSNYFILTTGVINYTRTLSALEIN